jgi:arylsulfatase A-like enzyme
MEEASMPPNILLYICHDAGRCVSPYGYDTFDTPHFARLAATGVRCANHFCTFPVCSPSRAAIVTGRYPHQNGVDGLVGPDRGFAFHPGEVHAARRFADAGYESVLCGQVHETDDCTTLGFERFLCGPGTAYNDGGDLLDYGAGIAAWLAARDAGRPFYLQLGSSDVHRQWTKRAAPDDRLGIWRPPWLHDTAEVRRDVAEFQGGVKRLDEGLGRILAALDRAGVADQTIVAMTTDHGADFPLAKSTLRDPGIETYLFLRYPAGGWGAGRVVDELISNVDLLPTLLEAAGLPVPGVMAGRSFLPLLTGADHRPREAVFAEKSFADRYDPRRCVRTRTHKYIRYFELDSCCNVRPATVERLGQCRLPWLRIESEALYDLAADPGETTNLAGEPGQAAVLADLRGRLARWMRDTGDPLLHGPMESPAYRRRRRELAAALADPLPPAAVAPDRMEETP